MYYIYLASIFSQSLTLPFSYLSFRSFARIMAAAQLGWLDIHGHFRLPETEKQALQRCEMMRQGQFLISKPNIWNAKETIASLDHAGVKMQMLSNIPKTIRELQASNDYGTSPVQDYPSSFGILAALPTNDPEACPPRSAEWLWQTTSQSPLFTMEFGLAMHLWIPYGPL
jgi:hypothetical protein